MVRRIERDVIAGGVFTSFPICAESSFGHPPIHQDSQYAVPATQSHFPSAVGSDQCIGPDLYTVGRAQSDVCVDNREITQ